MTGRYIVIWISSISLLLPQLDTLESLKNGDKQFKLLNNRLSKGEAKGKCHREGPKWDLPDSQSHFLNLGEILKTASTAWLDINRHHFTNWTWIDGTTYKDEFDITSNGLCAGLTVQGELIRSMRCSESGIGFVCQLDEDCGLKHLKQTCISFKGKWYLVGCYSRNWYDARKFCIQQGGDLAVLSDRESQKVVFNYIIEKKLYDACGWAFIGLRKEDWVISNGTKYIQTALWDTDQPKQGNCAIVKNIHADGFKLAWESKPCRERHNVICQNYGASNYTCGFQVPTESTKTKDAVYKRTSGETASNVAFVSIPSVIIWIVCLVSTCVYCARRQIKSHRRSLQHFPIREDSSTSVIVIFSSMEISQKKQDKLNVISVPYFKMSLHTLMSTNSPVVDVLKTSKVVDVLETSYRKIDQKNTLTIINVYSPRFTKELPSDEVLQILNWLLYDSQIIDVVLLPAFQQNSSKEKQLESNKRILENNKGILELLWKLREKVILITEATTCSSLLANEIIAVNPLVCAEPSGNVDFCIHDADDESVPSYGAAYASGLAAAMWAASGRRESGSKTTLMRRAFLQMVTMNRSVYMGFGQLSMGFGQLKSDTIREFAVRTLQNTDLVNTWYVNLNAEDIRKLKRVQQNAGHDPELPAQREESTKVKIALLRPDPSKDYNGLSKSGWTINIKSQDIQNEQKMPLRDEEIDTIIQTLLHLKPKDMDVQVLQKNLEIYWFTVCDEVWNFNEKDFDKFLEEIFECDIIYFTNLDDPPSKEIQEHLLQMSNKHVVLTRAMNVHDQCVPCDFPGDRVIAVGQIWEDAYNQDTVIAIPSISHNADNTNIQMDVLNSNHDASIPLITQKSREPPSNHISGSTLDFLCGFNIDLDGGRFRSPNFQAIAVVAIILIKAKLAGDEQGIDDNTLKRISTTAVMHSILRHLSSHPDRHDMDEGWGKLQPEEWLKDDKAFSDLIKQYGSPDYKNRYWIGKNV